VVALFSCLNLTFLVYGFKAHHSVAAAGLAPSDSAPSFNIKTIGSDSTISNTDVAQTVGLVINFISSDCPYCKEQLPVLEAVATELASSSYRFVNVSPTVSSELIQHSSMIEWVEDKEGYLRELFKVTGFPTLFVIGTEGKILQVIYGVPDQLKHQLLTSLSN
jgi:thiol-disulfide isomerase/thioredoxin